MRRSERLTVTTPIRSAESRNSTYSWASWNKRNSVKRRSNQLSTTYSTTQKVLPSDGHFRSSLARPPPVGSVLRIQAGIRSKISRTCSMAMWQAAAVRNFMRSLTTISSSAHPAMRRSPRSIRRSLWRPRRSTITIRTGF